MKNLLSKIDKRLLSLKIAYNNKNLIFLFSIQTFFR